VSACAHSWRCFDHETDDAFAYPNGGAVWSLIPLGDNEPFMTGAFTYLRSAVHWAQDVGLNVVCLLPLSSVVVALADDQLPLHLSQIIDLVSVHRVKVKRVCERLTDAGCVFGSMVCRLDTTGKDRLKYLVHALPTNYYA
jgi:hypothetical protein